MAKEDLSDTLALFEPILDIPEDRLRPIRLHHPSFREFLLTAERCNDLRFRVDECHAHMAILQRSIDLMLGSFGKDDVCDLRDPGALLSDLNPNDLQQHLPSEIQYACLFWVQHLIKSRTNITDNDVTHRFIKTHLLRWFEALAWMEQMAEGIATLDLLTSATSVSIHYAPKEFYLRLSRLNVHLFSENSSKMQNDSCNTANLLSAKLLLKYTSAL